MTAALQTLRFARSDALRDLKKIASRATDALLVLDPTSVYVNTVLHDYDKVMAILFCAQADFDATEVEE